MIPHYCDYIHCYIHGKGRSSLPAPGEHHFVSAYLIPKLFAINGKVPDYINPDGTKSILGDVVYYLDGKHHFGIEVKLGVIRLTKREFNEWIVETDSICWPNLFIGIGHKGIGLATWKEFRHAYIAAIQSKKPGWSPCRIPHGYGPMKSVDQLLLHLPTESNFPCSAIPEEKAKWEVKFTDALRKAIRF